jgi:hypothetical protein
MMMGNGRQALSRGTRRSERRGRAATCQQCRTLLLASPSRRVKHQMLPSRRHLHVVSAGPRTSTQACRTCSCALPRESVLGFCALCQAVYDAARELHLRRVEWCWARIEDAWRPLIGDLTTERRDRLRAHLAAHAAEPGGVSMCAIEDFLAELHDLADLERKR